MPEIITRKIAQEKLEKYIGQDLSVFAKEFNINIFTKNLKWNKGWKGLVLERLAGLNNNNSKAPNGLGFELKSTSYRLYKNTYIPKETVAICMVNISELKSQDFYNSHLWAKLKTLIFCPVSWTKKFDTNSKLLAVQTFDNLNSDVLIQNIMSDYNFIRNKLLDSGFESLTSSDGNFLQTRTKGSGHGSTSRAFYLKKQAILQLITEININV